MADRPRRPKRGDLFEHGHVITGSPKAGTAAPAVFKVTAVRAGSVYYRAADGGTLWAADVAKMDDTLPGRRIVGRWLPR